MNTMHKFASIAGLLLLLGGAVAAAQDSGVLAAKAELKREPFLDAETVSKLPAESAVTIVERKGAWLKVQAGEQSGWLRMLNVRSTPASGKSGESGLGKAFNLAISGSTGSSVATGVRGLDKEQIAKATPNLAELTRLDAYVVTDVAARSFAGKDPRLAEPKVDYLPAK